MLKWEKTVFGHTFQTLTIKSLFADNQTRYICTKRPFYVWACGVSLDVLWVYCSLSLSVSVRVFVNLWIYKCQTSVSADSTGKIISSFSLAPQIWFSFPETCVCSLPNHSISPGLLLFGGAPSSVLSTCRAARPGVLTGWYVWTVRKYVHAHLFDIQTRPLQSLDQLYVIKICMWEHEVKLWVRGCLPIFCFLNRHLFARN